MGWKKTVRDSLVSLLLPADIKRDNAEVENSSKGYRWSKRQIIRLQEGSYRNSDSQVCLTQCFLWQQLGEVVKLCISLCLGYDFRTQPVVDINIMTSLFQLQQDNLQASDLHFKPLKSVLDNREKTPLSSKPECYNLKFSERNTWC